MLSLAFFSLRAGDSASATALAGMAQSVAYLFAAIGPVLFGILNDTTGDWRVPLIVMVVLAGAQVLSRSIIELHGLSCGYAA